MTDSNFMFNRPYKPFGMNVKVPERTIQQAGETLEELVKAPAAPLFEFLEENESVFNGDVLRCVWKMKRLMAETRVLTCIFNLL